MSRDAFTARLYEDPVLLGKYEEVVVSAISEQATMDGYVLNREDVREILADLIRKFSDNPLTRGYVR